MSLSLSASVLSRWAVSDGDAAAAAVVEETRASVEDVLEDVPLPQAQTPIVSRTAAGSTSDRLILMALRANHMRMHLIDLNRRNRPGIVGQE
jgi:hypothetical protein